MATTKKKQTIRVTNTGPIREFEVDIAPGVSVARGANGVGKTHLMAAVTKALGGDPEMPLTATDGMPKGNVAINGVVLLAIAKSNRTAGKADVALVSTSPLTTLVDPDIADPVRAENARLKALLQLVDCPVTESTIPTLVGGDAEAVEYLEGMPPGDVVQLADSVRRNMHLAKRHHDLEAVRAGAEADAAKVETPSAISDVSVETAQTASDGSLMELQRLTGEASQRAARERERAEIEATLGERPDVESEREKLRVAENAVNDVEIEIQSINGELLKLQERLDAKSTELQRLEDAGRTADAAVDRAVEAAQQYDRRLEILGSEITGATSDDVEAQKTKVLTTRAALELARVSETYRKSLETVAEARERQSAAETKAKHFEAIALKVTSRLGELLAATGVEGLTVDDGVLSVIHDDGSVEAFSRLSLGQRTRIAADLVAKHAPDGAILTLSDRFWHALDDANKLEVAQIFAAFGISCLTESADEGELRVEAFQ